MQMLKTGQRLTLFSPRLQLSGTACAAVAVALDVAGRAVNVDLAEHPLGTLFRGPQAGQLSLDLASLPADVRTVAVFNSSGTSGEIFVTCGAEQHSHESPGDAAQAGTQVRLVKFYRRGGEWKLTAGQQERNAVLYGVSLFFRTYFSQVVRSPR